MALTSEPDRVGSLDVKAPLPGCDHCAISFDYISDIVPEASSPVWVTTQRDWHKGRFKGIVHKLDNVDWDLELAYLNADQSFKHLSAKLQKLTAEYIPLKPKGVRKPPWSTRPPNSLISQRQCAWSQYKNARRQLGRHSVETHGQYSTFSKLNYQCPTYAVKAQAKYEEDIVLKSTDQPKLLHSYIRKKKVSRPTVGPLKLPSGQLCDDPKSMSEIFSEAFSTVNASIPADPHPHQQFHGSSLGSITITQESVLKVLLDIDGNSAMGPDKIHPLLLKTCAEQLAFPLTRALLGLWIFHRLLGGGRLNAPPMISAPGRRREKRKAAFESSRKIISKSFRSFFCSGQNWALQGSKFQNFPKRFFDNKIFNFKCRATNLIPSCLSR